MVVEISIKNENGEVVDCVKWHGNLSTHQGEVEMLLGNMMRNAAEQSVHADAGDSVASSDISNASAESTSQTETKPAQRG